MIALHRKYGTHGLNGLSRPIIRVKIQDSRSLYYLVREITLWYFDVHHNSINKHRKLHCKIVAHKRESNIYVS